MRVVLLLALFVGAGAVRPAGAAGLYPDGRRAVCALPASLQGRFHTRITFQDMARKGLSPTMTGPWILRVEGCRFGLFHRGVRRDAGTLTVWPRTVAGPAHGIVIASADSCRKPSSYIYRASRVGVAFALGPPYYAAGCPARAAIALREWLR